MRTMPANTDQWAYKIQEAFYEDYPELSRYPLNISLKDKNFAKGYAVGSIKVASNFAVPVIIDKGKLHDFDVALVNGSTMPLTQDTLIEMMSNPSAFERAENPGKNQSDLEKLFNPELTYPQDEMKTASFLEIVLPTITKEDKINLLKSFDEKDLISFNKNATLNILKNIVDHEPKEQQLSKYASDNLSRDRQYIHKVARNRYRLYQGNSVVYDPIVTEINEEESIAFTNKYAEAKKIEKSIEKKASYIKSEAGMGKSGVFLDKDKTEFLKMSISRDLTVDGERVFFGNDGLKTIRAAVCPVKSIVKVAEDSYMLPKDFIFYEHKEVPVNIIHEGRAHTVTREDEDSYNFFGPKFEEYKRQGNQTSNLNKEAANWLAISCGICESEFNQMQDLRKYASLELKESDINIPVPISVLTKKLEQRSLEKKAQIKPIKDEVAKVIKIAAFLKDPQNVNGILSLGMINDKNIAAYADNVPIFQKVANNLAHLLLVSRLSGAVDQAPIKDAMLSLTKVATQLRNLNRSRKTLNM